MIRSFLTVSSGTLASRLLGFARDAMLAALLGTGAVADAFLVAFQGVNVVRRLLTEGALNASLVPAWLRIRETEGTAAAAAFAGNVLGTVSVAMFAVVALVGLGLPPLMAALAPDRAGDPALHFAIENARLMLPYVAFAGPVAVMVALLNAQGRFALTAFSPLLFNGALIAVMIALLAQQQDAGTATRLLAITIGIAGLLQMAVVVVGRGGDLATPVSIGFDAPMRGFLGKAVPGMIASAGPQLLILGGAVIASSAPSAVSWLYFANRLIELPLGLVGVAIGAVLVPELTRGVRANDSGAIAHAESRGLELSVGLALPATLGLIALSEPIVRLLFQHGAFTAADTMATAQAMMWLALGLPAHVLIKALSPAFFAREDTRTPLWATLKGFAVAILLAVLLGHAYGASGIAAAIALGAWSSALSLIRNGAATFGFSIDAAARRRLPRIVTAALVMGGLLWLAAAFALPTTTAPHGLVQAALLGVLISAGMAIYGGLLALFGVTDWAEAAAAIRQSRASGLRE